MNYTLTTIYIEDKDRKRLNNRYCDNCGVKILRKETEGLEQWINRRFCCKKCIFKYRKEWGRKFPNFEYKIREVGNCKKSKSYGLTIPMWFVKKYQLKPSYYSFEFKRGKFIIYTKKKKGLKMMKLRYMGIRDYMQIGIPIDIVRKYKLQGKLFKFEDKGKKSLFYIDTKEVKK